MSVALRDPTELEDGWRKMRSGVDKLIGILEKESDAQFTAEEYMTLYTNIYNMCTQKHPHEYSEQLYRRYREVFDQYIVERVLPRLQETDLGEQLLKEVHVRWENHRVMVKWLRNFFDYLDRYHVVRHNLPTLNEVGLITFRDTVFQHNKLRTKDALLTLIEREREGEIIDRSLVKGILTIFIDVGMGEMAIYEEDFEAHLLEATHQYYERKAALWVQEDSCPDFLRKAETCLLAEEDRADSYLHSSSKRKLLDAVQAELLQKCAQQLLEKESGCSAMLQDNKVEDLSRLCRVFSRVTDGLSPIADIFRKHIEDEGMALVAEVTGAAGAKGSGAEQSAAKKEAANAEQNYIRRILDLQDKYLEVVNECFNAHSLLHKALKEAFETFCNKNAGGTSTAELMANFCDTLLKKGGSEKLIDEELDRTLEKVVKLLAYISDKDLFSEFYRKKLARRLLSSSQSDEHETTFLQRLKQQCGAQFTSKMEGMVNDLRVARSKQQDFESWAKGKGKDLPVGLDVKVLTTGYWPSYKAVDLALPAEMVACVETFVSFYEDTTKHRKLTWMHSLGGITLKAKFNKANKELIIGPYQAALLMLFNDADELSYTEIKERLKLPDDETMRALSSLTCNKYHVLKRTNSTAKTVCKDDVFRVNADFTDKMFRIKIPMPHPEDKRKVVEDVQKDRRHAIDAAIVRIMKARKVLQHQNLVLEVMQQLSRMFKADNKTIKKRLEDLINREYIERDKDNAQLFKYVA